MRVTLLGVVLAVLAFAYAHRSPALAQADAARRAAPAIAAAAARLTAWHRACDAFIGQTGAQLEATYTPGFGIKAQAACQRDFEALSR
jgi:hypothetical protein